ncbi:hypothetical protein V1264_011241 [Littorina saxatilis]|uniref:Uncharacterized protein n=1 Tax=Littorina saxatilis TaxID=31220 RepID=A0AAN9BXW2_9CAEN
MDRLPVFYTLLDILLVVAGRKDNSVLNFSRLSHAVPAEKLRCYDCQQNQHGCLSLANFSHVPVTYCDLDQPHCMVKRVESDGKLRDFSRSCASKCLPGCERGVSHTTCFSCCNTIRCNTDSKASRHCTRALFILLMCVSVWLLKR